MQIKLALIGLGQIGASLGLALRPYQKKLTRTGYDRDPDVMQRALEMGAVDRTVSTPVEAVAEADIVFLSVPLDEIPDILQKIAPSLPEDCVVLETSPIKQPVAEWMAATLPPRRHHVGLIPVVNPRYLHETVKGIEGAHPDLFANSSIVIASRVDTAAEAIKLASDLTRLAGSNPIFMNLEEADAAMASVHILPQLLAAALLNVSLAQPGQEEAGQLAGRPYAEATAPIMYQDDRLALRDAALLNKENVLRALDSVMAALRHLQQAIEQGDEAALQEQIQRAHEGRRRWLADRERNDWLGEELSAADIKSVGEQVRYMFGFRPR